jgi:hypothetical protein
MKMRVWNFGINRWKYFGGSLDDLLLAEPQ